MHDIEKAREYITTWSLEWQEIVARFPEGSVIGQQEIGRLHEDFCLRQEPRLKRVRRADGTHKKVPMSMRQTRIWCGAKRARGLVRLGYWEKT